MAHHKESSQSFVQGERFYVTYRLTGTEKEALGKAKAICLEQSVDLPPHALPKGKAAESVVGYIESFDAVDGRYRAIISYAAEAVGGELPQLLNVVFGNASLSPGVRVLEITPGEGQLKAFTGPRFGRGGVRWYLGVPERPLLCAALKPLGLSAEALAGLAYRMALGGIDVVTDHVSFADQSFAGYNERIDRCAEAVGRANAETGQNSIYVANITAPAHEVLPRALYAREKGAGGLLIAPGITGLDAMRQVAEDDRVALPLLSHPALQGAFVTNPDGGISPFALFGQLARLAGADAVVYPGFTGAIRFTKEECRAVIKGTEVPMGGVKPSFPAPSGGVKLEDIPELLNFYGSDVMIFIGAELFTSGTDITENGRRFRKTVETHGRK